MAGWRDIPALVRHSTIAIYTKSTAGGPNGFLQALRISRDTLAKQGYLYHGARSPILAGILLTSKGWEREQRHLSEGQAGKIKDQQFANLWKMIEPRLDDLGGDRRNLVPGDIPFEDGKQQKVELDDRPVPAYPPKRKG